MLEGNTDWPQRPVLSKTLPMVNCRLSPDRQRFIGIAAGLGRDVDAYAIMIPIAISLGGSIRMR